MIADEESAWVNNYAGLQQLGHGRGRAESSESPGSTHCSTPMGSSESARAASKSALREYRSLGNQELWRWLWLDFSREARSPTARRFKRKLSGSNLQALMQDDEESPAASVSEEAASLGAGSLSASVFTLVSSAMGAGCLSLPFMFKQSGILLGLVMLLLGAALAHVSLVILMSCAKYTDSESLSRLVALTSKGTAGRRGRGQVVDIVIAIYGIAAVLCYLIFIGDFFSGIVLSPFVGWDVSREALIAGLAVLVVWPLSLFRSLAALRYICVLSVLAICFTSVVVACKVPEQQAAGQALQEADGRGLGDAWEIVWWNPDPSAALQSFSIALFAFAAHTNAVPVASALRKSDSSSIWCVSLYSVGIEFIFYAVMGLGGYLSFRGFTKQDFILNYSNDDVVMFCIRCVYGVVVCLGAPINLSPAAASLLDLIAPGAKGHNSRAAWPTHVAIVTLIIAGCACVAIWNEEVADVIGLCGASFGTLIVLAWPALVYRRVLYELHPPRLARSVFYFLASAACLGFLAFAVQAKAKWFGPGAA